MSILWAIMGMVLVALYIKSSQDTFAKENGDFVAVVRVQEDVAEFKEVTAEVLTLQFLPKKFVPESAVSKISDATGMISLITLKKGDFLLKSALKPPGPEVGISNIVSLNQRAVAVPISQVSGVSMLVKPGDHVDVMGKIKVDEDGRSKVQMKTLFQNVRVLSIGGQLPGDLQNYSHVETATLELSPEQTQSVALLLSDGSPIYLALRNNLDHYESDIPAVKMGDLYENGYVPAAAPVVAPRALATTPSPKWRDPFWEGGGLLEMF